MKNLWFYFLFFWMFSFSQKEGKERIDSLLIELPKVKSDSLKVKILNDISFNYQNSNPKLGQHYATKALLLSQKIKFNDGIAEAYRTLGINYSVDSDFNKALYYYEKALKSTKNEKILSTILRSTGLIYTYQNDYKKAMDYDMQALKMSEEIADKKGTAAVLSNIGIIYFDLGNYKKAIYYYKKAQEINQQMGNKAYLSNNLGNIANCLLELKEFDKAIRYYKKSIIICDELGDVSNKSIRLGAIGDLYFQQEKYEQSLSYSIASLKLSKQINDYRNMAHGEALIGEIYLAQSAKITNKNERFNLLKKAKIQFNKALILDKKLNGLKDIATDYQSLSEIEELLNNHKEALRLFRISVTYKDSVFNEVSKETIKNLEDKRTIELRNKEIKISKINLKNKEKQKWYFVGGLFLLGIIGSLLFYQSRNRNKMNHKLQLINADLDNANKSKIKLIGILNHDLRSPVNNFIHYMQFKKESPITIDENVAERIENSTLQSARNLLNSMEQILFWTKDQMENFKPQPKNIAVNDLFKDVATHFSSFENIKLQFENYENILLNTDENYLKTIIRNLTGNAIKALDSFVPRNDNENPTIMWKAYNENGKSFISITDNGKGATHEQFKALYDDKEVSGIQSGLGLHLIRDLAKAIDCEIFIDSKIDAGTTFTLKL